MPTLKSTPEFISRLFPWAIALALVLWFLQSPESVAGLIDAGVELIKSGANSFSRFVSALTPTITNLF